MEEKKEVEVDSRELFAKSQTVAMLGLDEMVKYFNASPSNSKMRIARAHIGLRAVGQYTTLRKVRAQEAAIVVKIAEMAGLKGEALAPVFAKLTGGPMEEYQENEA